MTYRSPRNPYSFDSELNVGPVRRGPYAMYADEIIPDTETPPAPTAADIPLPQAFPSSPRLSEVIGGSSSSPEISQPKLMSRGKQDKPYAGSYKGKIPPYYAHRVEKGQTLGQIARGLGLSVEDIMRANPQIMDPNRIAAGATLKLPVPELVPPPATMHLPAPFTDEEMYDAKPAPSMRSQGEDLGLAIRGQMLGALQDQLGSQQAIRARQRASSPFAPSMRGQGEDLGMSIRGQILDALQGQLRSQQAIKGGQRRR